MKKFCYLILFFLSFLCLPASAKIRLPHILCDNMVLQQQADARLWGWATPRTRVIIKPSWGPSHTTMADKEGRWGLRIRTPKGSYTPLSITFLPEKCGSVPGRATWKCPCKVSMSVP